MSTLISRVTPRPERLKRCTKCDDWLPIGCFNKYHKSPDGHEWWCRACRHKMREPYNARRRKGKDS
jgi:hypothetical protein